MKWMILLFAASVSAIDWFVWRRPRRGLPSAGRWRRTILAGIAICNLLPLTTLVTGELLRDNPTPWIKTSMWISYFFMLFTLPRLLLYAGIVSPRKWIRYAGAAAAVALFGAIVCGFAVWRTRLIVNTVDVYSDRIPAAFDGYRIVFFSDLHIGSLVCPRSETERLAERIAGLKPDAILFGGDLVNIRYTELDDTMQRVLRSIEAPDGVYSVIGNHDTGAYVKDSIALPREENLRRLIGRQQAMGWCVLEDRSVFLHRGGDSIALTGISFPLSQRNLRHARELPGIDLETTYDEIPETSYDVTLVHLPQLWDRLLRSDLTLAGHVHAMQCKVRLFDRAFSPARLLYRRWSGPYTDDRRMLYINDGIGYVAYPMRLGARPELTLLVLHSERP